MVGRLRRVAVRRPDEAMAAADPATWHCSSRIDLPFAQTAHDAFMSIQGGEGGPTCLTRPVLRDHA